MLKSKIKSNQLFDWLFSFWKAADTNNEIVHWQKGDSKGISFLYDWTANGYENNNIFPLRAIKHTIKDILKYKKGFWSKAKCIKIYVLDHFIKRYWTWTNWGQFQQMNAYRWSLDILTLNLREYRYQTKGDQYGIEGVTRYQHRDRFYFSKNWSEWQTYDCYSIDDNSKITDEQFEEWGGDDYEC
jgi:hypothetical protein